MYLEVITQSASDHVRSTPILFVHGGWIGAWFWQEHFMPYFAEYDYTSYALSLRGHADSPRFKPMFLHGVADYVADVAQVAEQIEQEIGTRPVIIGHSMGGYVTQKYLEHYTAPAAVLMASLPVMGALPFQWRLTLSHPIPTLKSLLTLNGHHLIARQEHAHELFFAESMPESQVAEYHARLGSESIRILLDAGIIRRPRPDSINPTPILVLAAGQDKVFPLREQEATAHAYGATLEVLPDMAHSIALEAEWQEAADRIISWLGEQGI